MKLKDLFSSRARRAGETDTDKRSDDQKAKDDQDAATAVTAAATTVTISSS